MVRKQTLLEKYQQRLAKLEQEIQKAEELIATTQEQVKQKRKELEQVELMVAKELLITNNMSVQDLAELLSQN